MYSFTIPLNEIGIDSARQAHEVQMAFAAYGTAAPVALTAVPNPINYGNVGVGTSTGAATVTVTNPNAGFALTLDNPSINRGGPDTAMFAISNNTCSNGLVLGARASCSFDVTFSPASTGAKSDTATVCVSGCGGLSRIVTFLGTGVVNVNIPTLNEWGMIVFSILLGLYALYVIRKRQSA